MIFRPLLLLLSVQYDVHLNELLILHLLAAPDQMISPTRADDQGAQRVYCVLNSAAVHMA